MSTTFTFSDIPAGIKNHKNTQTANTGSELDLEVIGVKNDVAHNITPDATSETAKKINYRQLATEHAELIAQGKTSVEIAGWIGEKLSISSWKAGDFLGERKVLSSPQTPEEAQRLQKFIQALGVSWTKANGGSNNHSQYLLLDGYVQNALFGQANMTEVDARLGTFHTDWQKMGNDFTSKAKYLLEKVGLDIKGDWSKLTGIRGTDGGFFSSGGLYAAGSLDGDVVRRLGLYQLDSVVGLDSASNARLCFLA